MPDETDSHELAASICRELGDVEGAIVAQRRVVAASAGDAAAAIALADLLIVTERAEEAIALLHPLGYLHDREVDTKLADLVYFHVDDATASRFEGLYERARAVGYANTDYALKNDHELFAVSYTDFLRERYRLPDVPISDDAGIRAALMAFFADACSRH